MCSVRVHEGPWQKVLPKLAANAYDLIFYDPLNISPRQGNLKHRKKSDGSPKHLNLGVLRCSRSLGFPFFPTDDGSDFRQLKNMAEILCPAADILERSSSTKVGASRFVSLRHSSHELRGKFMVESPISDAQKAVSSHSNFHMRNPHFLCNLVQLFHSLTIICKVWHDLRWFEVLQTVETWWRGCPVRYIPQDASPSWNQDEEDVGLSISKNTQPSCNLPGKTMAFEFESVWLEVANNFGSQPLSWPKFLRWVTGNVMGHCTMDPCNCRSAWTACCCWWLLLFIPDIYTRQKANIPEHHLLIGAPL